LDFDERPIRTSRILRTGAMSLAQVMARVLRSLVASSAMWF